MNFLVTGGCGFLGTALVKRLTALNGNNIRIIDNLVVGTREDLATVTKYSERKSVDGAPDGVELIVGDIRDERLAIEVAKGCDVIVHLAANTGVGPSVEDPRLDCVTNVIGTFNYLEAARANGTRRFIFASSGAPAGEVTPPIHEEIPPHPVSPYGASKLAGEGYCSAYFRTFGIQTVALRFGNVYGPGSIHKASVVAKFVKRAMNDQELEIFGDGGQTRDFIFIDDLIDAILLAASMPDVGGETFQIASGRETTVSEIAQCLMQILTEMGIPNVRISNCADRRGDVRRNFSDTRKAARLLHWHPKMTLDEGLRTTVAYFVAAQKAGPATSDGHAA